MIITNESEMIAVMVQRRKQLGISCEALDDKVGVPVRYINKLENPETSGKRAISRTYWYWLQALNMSLIAIPNDALTAVRFGTDKRFAKVRDRSPESPLPPLTLKIKEVLELVPIGRTMLFELIKTGAIPSIKVGRRTLVPYEGLRQFLQAKRQRRKIKG